MGLEEYRGIVCLVGMSGIIGGIVLGVSRGVGERGT